MSSSAQRFHLSLPVLALVMAVLPLSGWCADNTPTPAPPLASYTAQAGTGAASVAFDASVEAIRQTVIAAQVPGEVVELAVKAGDRVKAGQTLVRIDARAAQQSAAASAAQVQAARAQLELATREFERQKQLAARSFISQAALERAEAEFKAAQAQSNAQIAQAQAAQTQTGFHLVRAPYAGVVAEVPVALGDMAMPGRPLLTLYDPAALRVTAAVPQSVAARLKPGQLARVEIPALAGELSPKVTRTEVLPTADPSTHTVPVRADLAPDATTRSLAPGMYARLSLPVPATGGAVAASPMVPASAVVRRGELTALYVLDPQGRPILRQVRLGRVDGDRVEVLSGLNAGERVATDPQAAARRR